MPEDGYKVNDTCDDRIFGFLKKAPKAEWEKEGFVVVEPHAVLANLSYADVRREPYKLSKDGKDPIQGQPPRLKKLTK